MTPHTNPIPLVGLSAKSLFIFWNGVFSVNQFKIFQYFKIEFSLHRHCGCSVRCFCIQDIAGLRIQLNRKNMWFFTSYRVTYETNYFLMIVPKYQVVPVQIHHIGINNIIYISWLQITDGNWFGVCFCFVSFKLILSIYS